MESDFAVISTTNQVVAVDHHRRAVSDPDAYGPPDTDDIDPVTGEPMISEDAAPLPDPDDDLKAMVTATRAE